MLRCDRSKDATAREQQQQQQQEEEEEDEEKLGSRCRWFLCRYGMRRR
jgi:hypothetical protein